MTGLQEKLQTFVEFLLLAILLLAPIKFGAMLLPGVPQFYNLDFWNLTVNSLPPAFFPVAAGLLLLLALAAFGVNDALAAGRGSLIYLLAVKALLIAALAGFVNADNLESPVVEFEYISGIAAFAAAFWIVLAARGEIFRQRVFNMISAGTVITALAGAHQYFFGFDELRDFIEMQEKIYHVQLPEALKNRAYDVRTYATFTFASALAAMFCLTGALSVARAYKWGGKFEPVKLSRRLFVLLGTVLIGGIFLTTKGRGAFLAVIMAAALTGWVLLKNRKMKILMVLAAVAAVIAGACYIHYAGRGFASMSERVGYLKSSCSMVAEQPFFGGGWGNFTYHHALNKSFGNEELAKDPHNVIAAFAAQTGVFGGLLVLSLLVGVIVAAGKKLKTDVSRENAALFFGLTAFSLHMLMDLDWQVPALMMLWCALSLSVLYRKNDRVRGQKQWQDYLLALVFGFTGLMAVAGGVHWSVYDGRLAALQTACGMEFGSNQQPAGRYEVDALALSALKAAPYSPAIYSAWGMDALRRNDLSAAAERFGKVLELAPRSHAAYETLAEIARRQNDPVKMREYLDKADKLFPYKNIFFEQHPEKRR